MHESNRAITSAFVLTELLRELKLLLSSGELLQVTRQGVPDDTIIAHLPDTGPWPDIIQAAFQRPNGGRFELSVETYHGIGGMWRRIETAG